MTILASVGRAGLFFSLASWSGCASAPPPLEPPTHQHRVTTTVSIGDHGVAPRAEVQIPVLSTIVWRNLGAAPATVEIELTTCGRCETVLGFAPGPNGARSLPIAPGGIATICFHETGTFPFTARLGDTVHTGSITVQEEP
ncbi:MAG: hypothetical protein U1F60_13670 [Planctomycetota bacterium]